MFPAKGSVLVRGAVKIREKNVSQSTPDEFLWERAINSGKVFSLTLTDTHTQKAHDHIIASLGVGVCPKTSLFDICSVLIALEV